MAKADDTKTEAVNENGLTAAEQAEMDRLEQEEADKNAANTGIAAGGTVIPADRAKKLRDKQVAYAKAQRDKEATVEATVARGRTVFTEAGQTAPHKAGDKIMVTPLEYAKLVQAGAVLAPNGGTEEPEGPAVFRDLIQGHGKGQGVTIESKAK